MNELRLLDPFALDPIDDAFRTMLRPWRAGRADLAPSIRIDVSEQDGSYLVNAEIPGVRKEDIDVRIDGDLVTISAEAKTDNEVKENGRVLRKERQEGYASRTFKLDCPVDDAAVNATYKDGVLALKLPKKASAASRRIAIQ